jgi:ribosomal-protein-alanine N-acetyltransferase
MLITMQRLTPKNCLHAFAIHQSCHLLPWSESAFKDCLTSPYFAYQLSSNHDVVGYFVGLAVAGEATLMDIGVRHAFRDQGNGDKLLTEFKVQAQCHDCEEIWLEVRESNVSAKNLYEKHGFTSVEVRKGYYPTETGRENGLIMRALLA